MGTTIWREDMARRSKQVLRAEYYVQPDIVQHTVEFALKMRPEMERTILYFRMHAPANKHEPSPATHASSFDI